MIHFKNTVDFRILKPQLAVLLLVVDQQNPRPDLGTLVTSISDDAPGRLPNSLHKVGLALDLHLLPTKELNEEWTRCIKFILGPQWDIVLESDHIHCEFDPKPFRDKS